MCDGSSAYSMANLECIVPLATLIEAPYNLEYNDSIWARVIATNIFGDSQESNSGNGAVVYVVPDAPINLVKNIELSNDSQMAFSWEPAAFDGGQPVTEYRVQYDQAEGLFIPLETVTDPEYVTSFETSPGSTYAFVVEAKSSVGFSVFSAPIYILAAQKADVPSPPVSTIDAATIIISWSVAYDGATPITAYQILIRHADGLNFSEDLESCDGSDPTVISEQRCVVPVGTLRAAPFNLDWGVSVWAKVSATNVIGTTEFSSEGNGAIMLTSPDAPINLANVPEITTGSQIGLVWEDGAIDGGADVIDYKITWDQGTGEETVLVQFLNAQSYTVTGLTASVTYVFKVQSRNSFGYSAYSTPVAILSAQTPNIPAAPSTSFIGD